MRSVLCIGGFLFLMACSSSSDSADTLGGDTLVLDLASPEVSTPDLAGSDDTIVPDQAEPDLDQVDLSVSVCGDGACQPDEDCWLCPEDCGDCCGDNICSADPLESCSTCPWDCGECCGDGECAELEGETCITCVEDCGQCCGNGVCTPGHTEDCHTCQEDCGECGPECGDGVIHFDLDEQCDDGGLEPLDGCDGNCQVEPEEAMPGALIITEVMSDPKAVSDLAGEWIELRNTTAADIDLNGWHLLDEALDFHEIFSPQGVIVEAGAFFVLSWEEDPALNGGVTPDYVYKGFQLFNFGDTIVLRTGDTVVDKVVYDSTFPCDCGETMSLSPEFTDCLLNDQGEHWCPSASVLPSGDCGSPGTENPECVTVPCGNGVLDDGESCDDGNLTDEDGCDSECQLEPVCGNGIEEVGEFCDDGNLVSGDGCNAWCKLESEDPVCGNGLVEGPGAGWPDGEGTPGSEWCDDGNNLDGDGCSAKCQFEDFMPWICGNGHVEAANDEECDDGNTDAGDGCNQWCKEECNGVCEPCGNCCGDGFTTGEEECDDGNLENGDGCSDLCLDEVGQTAIKGTVFFEGKYLPGDLVYIVAHQMPNWDPTSAQELPEKSAAVIETEAQFPLPYELHVIPGYYWVTVVLNLGGDLTDGIGEEDICMTFAIGDVPAAVELSLGEKVEGVDLYLPADGSAASSSASGTIDYAGNVAPNDALYLVFSGEAPPSVLPVVTIKIKPVEFPFEYYVPYLVPWAYYIVAVLDRGDNYPDLDFTEPWGAYPSAESPLLVTIGQDLALEGYDFELVEPKQ